MQLTPTMMGCAYFIHAAFDRNKVEDTDNIPTLSQFVKILKMKDRTKGMILWV